MKVRFIEKRIEKWFNSVGKEKDRSVIESILAIRKVAPDGSSDSRHIRNSFAHGHFEVNDDGTVTVRDVGEEGEVFRVNYQLSELAEYFNLLQKKVGVIEATTHLLYATDDLFELFHPKLNLLRWEAKKEELVASYKMFNSWLKKVEFDDMTYHGWLSDDRKVATTAFSSGWHIAVNMSDKDFTFDKGVVKAMDYLIWKE